MDVACGAEGRDPATVVRTACAMVSFAPREYDQAEPRAGALSGSDSEIARALLDIHSAGISHLWIAMDNPASDGPVPCVPLQRMSDILRMSTVVAEVRRLEAATLGSG